MSRTRSLVRRLAACSMVIALPALAAEGTQKEVEEQAGRSPTELLDVEELRDRLPEIGSRTVNVAGEVDDKLDGRSFVLESGGLFDDEIVVIVPPEVAKAAGSIEEDEDLVVTGTVRRVRVIDIEREYDWDLDPELAVELEDTDHYLIASRISPQKR